VGTAMAGKGRCFWRFHVRKYVKSSETCERSSIQRDDDILVDAIAKPHRVEAELGVVSRDAQCHGLNPEQLGDILGDVRRELVVEESE